MRSLTMISLLCLSLFAAACSSEDIPQAHKGRMFDRTGALAFYAGGDGLTGSVLGPGTYYTGIYDQVRMVDCGLETKKEELTALTKDGVQFKLDVYITYSANCTDVEVVKLLNTLAPIAGHTICKEQLYNTYIRSAIGESVREVISPINANDINNGREKILADVRDRFQALVTKADAVLVTNTTLSNLDYPDEMDHANTERAVQAVWRDKAKAEKERVEQETDTAEAKRLLAEKEGEVEAARIDKIGQAYARNPAYAKLKMFEAAGQKGNMILTDGNAPNVMITPSGTK